MNDREKEIEEIVEVIRDTVGDYLINDETAEALYDAGYRKADEVSKGTAKDIIETLLIFKNLETDDVYLSVSYLKRLAKKYDVEITD